jgi:uncharacterized protein (DUF697 family)
VAKFIVASQPAGHYEGQCCELVIKVTASLGLQLQAVRTPMYIVQSIISWIGSIVALLCVTADTWSHEVVLCPFFSRPSKKQLRVCGVFRKKVTVMMGSYLQSAEIENVAV